MSTRYKAGPYQVLTDADLSTDQTSQVSIISTLSMPSYGLSWSGAAGTETVSVQVSNDYTVYADGTENNPGSWATIPLLYNGNTVTVIPLTAGSGAGLLDLALTGAYAMRLIATSNSGSGTLTVTFNAKVS